MVGRLSGKPTDNHGMYQTNTPSLHRIPASFLFSEVKMLHVSLLDNQTLITSLNILLLRNLIRVYSLVQDESLRLTSQQCVGHKAASHYNNLTCRFAQISKTFDPFLFWKWPITFMFSNFCYSTDINANFINRINRNMYDGANIVIYVCAHKASVGLTRERLTKPN